ncbi:FGGAP repeat domain containing protein [Yasminevirus sp. GU-2018]|uniref:FGGAP repeat domain containing protein n=1 Tax=Yasminevirus sp. GU-2018 TaxID=2420051 RepID=A0A5K0UAC8_9VIRU|nr:FGGAP repeat domain containing protein [Yasminevirus sp. GU-2018]
MVLIFIRYTFKTMIKFFSTIIIILLFNVGFLVGCGVTTHNVVSNIALTKLNELTYDDTIVNITDVINNNLPYFQSGSAFPDWGYNCFLGELNSTLQKYLHNASETAHWFNFMKASVNYIPKSKEPEKLIAFLLGVTSHSVADILWHNLGTVTKTHQGFIQALCNSDFNCQGEWYSSDVHMLADTGGEFINAKLYNLAFIKKRWVIPYEDVTNIYRSMGIELSPFQIETCFLELGLEIDSVIEASNLDKDHIMYDAIGSQAPFMIDFMNSWWMGGVESMAFHVQDCWRGVFEMIVTQDTTNTSEVCDVYQRSEGLILNGNEDYLLSDLI